MHQILSFIFKSSYLSRLCRLSFGVGCFYIAFASTLTLSQELEKPQFPARQNLILRQYFRTRFSEAYISQSHVTSSPSVFIENFIDRQIDNYITELDKRLNGIKFQSASLEVAAKELIFGEEGPNYLQFREMWKESMERIHDDAGVLHRMISYVFAGLKNKGDVEIDTGLEAKKIGFKKERLYLQKEIVKAEQRIRNYFFEPNHIIHLEELKGENMLIQLYRIRQITQKLKEVW